MAGIETTHDQLSKEQEISLGLRIQAGNQAALALTENDLTTSERRQYERLQENGKAARDELVTRNIPLANARARKFIGVGRDLDEMQADGYEALVRAATTFDPAKGARFSTLAWPHVTRAIQHGLDRKPLVRESDRNAKRRRKVNRETTQILVTTGEAPSAPELAEVIGLRLGDLDDLGRYDPRVATVDGALEIPCTKRTAAEMVPSHAEVVRCLDAMTPMQREVVTLLYGWDALGTEKSQAEVAEFLQISPQAICQAQTRAFQRVRKTFALTAA